MSFVLMRYMHSIFGRPVLSFDAAGRGQTTGTRPGPPMLGRFVQVYCDDNFIFSKRRKEHLVHVRMVLETLCATTSSSPRPPSVSSAGPRSASSGT